jgi:hypothetical protein
MAKKKRRPGRPRTTGRGTAIMVRMHEEQLAAIDAWARQGTKQLSRPEAIRQLVAIGLYAARRGSP